MIGNETILSKTGVQQGDPLGPVLFALAVDEIARSVRSPINIWYLDDATIGGPAESVCEDISRIIPMLLDIGLEVNPTKSEVSNVSCDNFQSVLIAIESALPGVTVIESEDLGILGAPIDINGCLTGVLKAVERLSTMSSRLESIDAHPAFFLLRNCLSMPRLLFKLRSSPCYRLHAELTHVTDMLHKKPLNTRNTRSSSYTMLLLNRPAHSKAALGDRSLSFASSSVWNSIPNDVRCASSLSSFKSHLKTYLFRSVYKD